MTIDDVDKLNGYTKPSYTITTDAAGAPDKLFALRQDTTIVVTGHCTQQNLNEMAQAIGSNEASSGEEDRNFYLDLSQTDLTSIGDDTFYECRYLKGVSIPASVETIGCGAFYYVESAKIPNSWRLKTIGPGAFYFLKAVVIPASTMYLWEADFIDSKLYPVRTRSDTTQSAFMDKMGYWGTPVRTQIYTYK